ncbi:MAG: delta-lactam-biosynthetic de-N-acetylase [Ruminococcaceae bacterium]|nr:delta-lactam-biosynthetic de-N-acetylase [Oscillospiraceae bacterium]
MSFIEDHGGYFLDRTVSENEPVIYLTFDAGYEKGNVEKILDTLKAENVPGAFFILDNLITTNTDLVKRMAEEGHLVCNHTAKHHDMSSVTDKEAFARELAALEEIYKEYTGYDMAMYYRPPEGRFSETNLIHAEELGYKTIFWSFAYADWDNNRQMSREKAMDKVLSGTHNGEILLLHPTSATNAEILPSLIKEWKRMGYRFGTLDELTAEA